MNHDPFYPYIKLVKMKNAIVFLLLLLNVGVAEAQYQISLIGTTAPYKCKIDRINPNDPTYAWTDLDLITWIFPDGQYMKSVVDADAQGIALNETDLVEWSPSANPPTGPVDIQAFIAKKGGTGNPPPPPQIKQPQNQNFSFGGPYNSNIQPMAIFFPIGSTWQIDKSWDLSPGDETFLIVSYNPALGCPSVSTDYIEVRFDPNKLMLMDKYGYNMENPIPHTNGTGMVDKVRIEHLSTSQTFEHVFLKVKPLVSAGQPVPITVVGTFCSFTDSTVLRYVVEEFPHDPNKKKVDIEKICLDQFYPIKLTYTVQFQNDGKAFVKEVDVKDLLPPQLDPESFHLITPVPGNGIDVGFDNTLDTNDPIKLIKFTGPGLPGLNQTIPFSYSYDQTIYRFSFEAEISAFFEDTIKNKAEVTFYNNGIPVIPSLLTSIAKTYGVDQFPGPDCYFSPTSEAPELIGQMDIKPNPFQNRIDIAFELAEKTQLSVEVRDIRGKLIKTLASGEYPAGAQQFTWEGTTLPDGVYLVFLRTEKGSIAKRMVKVR